jgi:hypothetical protein
LVGDFPGLEDATGRVQFIAEEEFNSRSRSGAYCRPAVHRLNGAKRNLDIAAQLARGPPGGKLAEISQYSIVTYERRPGLWRAAITPIRRPGAVTQGKTISSIVTPDDFLSEPDAKFAAEKMIRKI